jgi:GTPase SAR1 family protein
MAEILTPKEIAERLQDLPQHLVTGFAARAATHVLPVLATDCDEAEFLWFWEEEEREKHLSSLFQSLNVAWYAAGAGSVGKEKSIFANAANAATDAANAAANAAYDAVNVANAAYDAANAANAAYDAANAVTYAAYATDYNIVITEFKLLTSPANYLSQPLPKHHQSELFIQSLRKIGFDYWADWYQDRVDGKPIDLELIEKTIFLPNEITKSPREINAYLVNLRTGEAKQPLNKVRVIFIGHGAAGKTSLVRALHGESVVAGQEKMTCGIEIRHWALPESEIKAHFWDFGGQVMAHATHQFFLRSRCVYVLVLDARSDVNANMQAEYWLEHVRAFGSDAPVLIVWNKADLTPINLDFNSLKQKFENIIDLYPLSCTKYQADYKPEFERFLRDFSKIIRETVDQQQIYFTDAHFNVLTKLQKFTPRKAFLEETEFNQICNQFEVKQDGDLSRQWLLKLLDDLGVIIHFEKILWSKAYVLNPHWLTYGVYTVLYEDKTKRQQGRVSLQDVHDFLNQQPVKTDDGVTLKYSPDRCQFIIEAMEQFKLCYCVDMKDKIYMIPDLLSSDQPKELDFDKTVALAFDFDFEGLLPRHLIANLIVRRHHEIHNEMVWQNGVYFYNKNFEARALIQADYYNRRFSLWVNGKGASRYFSALHDDIMQMLEKMKKLQYQEWVVLPERYRKNQQTLPRVPFRTLLANERKGNQEYTCEYGDINLAEVLKIMPKDKREEVAKTVIHAERMFYNEGGTVHDTTFGDKTVITKEISKQVQAQIQELANKLKTLQFEIKTAIEDESVRQQSLAELRAIREALENIQKTDKVEQKEAQETLETFYERMKNGGSNLMNSLTYLRDSSETTQWVRDHITNLMTTLNSWVN